MKYDGLGQLKDKNLGTKPSGSGILANSTYLYNIRGWLLGINQGHVNSMGSDRYFAMELGYDRNTSWQQNTNLYNGNIAVVNWKTAGEDNVMRKLKFSYDRINRLITSTYLQSVTAKLDFSTNNLSYDPNGNILTMRQLGWTPNKIVTVDSLAYTYKLNTNQLLQVKDNKNDPYSLQGDFKTSLNHVQSKTTSTIDYEYDGNGNMVKDLNKDIAVANTTAAGASGILYNHLNLPTQITVRKTASSGRGTIAYTYDAAGNKLRKETVDVSTPGKTITTTTNYLMGLVYESRTTSPADTNNDYPIRLQLISHEEGRVRYTHSIGAAPSKLSYDYFLKDHLGNVRMVLTEETGSETYPELNFEGASGSPEMNAQNKYWETKTGGSINVDSSRISHSTGTNAILTRKSTGAIGATKLLKVMSGDTIQTNVKFYYTTTNANNTGANGINSLVANIATLINFSIAPTSTIKGGATSLGPDLLLQPSLVNSLNKPNSTSGSNQAPKAYLHVLLFNEQFQFDSANSKVVPVPYADSTWGTISLMGTNAVKVRKNGYAYVYVSNESDELVYFDNFNLTHARGPILEETHYYPFGLTMAGISSRAMGKLENKRKFGGKELNSKEFNDGSGMDLYDFGARHHDPQLGRWITIDPKAEKYYSSSPYNYVDNNPISRIDPTGKDWFYYQAKGETKKTWHYQDGNKATYINSKGKEITTRKGYSHLVGFVSSGKTNSDGAQMGTLVVYNQNKVQMKVEGAFTGGKGFSPVDKGVYMMRMDIKDKDGPQEMNAEKSNPKTAYGAQKLPNRYIQVDGKPTDTPIMDAYDIGGSWGRGRIRLNEVDDNLNIIQKPTDRGAFLHGKLNPNINWTHGCVCDKTEAVFNYLWNNTSGKVPFIVE